MATTNIYGAWCSDHWEDRFDRLLPGDRVIGAWMEPGRAYPTNTQPCDVPGCSQPAFMVYESAADNPFAGDDTFDAAIAEDAAKADAAIAAGLLRPDEA